MMSENCCLQIRCFALQLLSRTAGVLLLRKALPEDYSRVSVKCMPSSSLLRLPSQTPQNELTTPPNYELETPPNAELATPPDAVFANHFTKSKLWSECNFGSSAKCSSFRK
ncbi:hypothetical protein DdX_06717 [Ditylenchus destructor]|uniref:Uncharacterized protein n=1 Tax=Ditylenchus destructor TaxID=166010 RepID=A0AAD4R9D3_9BILA|nr:hypothetical protein DdX_06717 [Ditylenchus destructor]